MSGGLSESAEQLWRVLDALEQGVFPPQADVDWFVLAWRRAIFEADTTVENLEQSFGFNSWWRGQLRAAARAKAVSDLQNQDDAELTAADLHKKLKDYYRCEYKVDRQTAGCPAGERGSLFRIIESYGGVPGMTSVRNLIRKEKPRAQNPPILCFPDRPNLDSMTR